MRTLSRVVGGCLLSACVAGVIALQAQAPDMKLGLWEMTIEMPGMPAMPPGAAAGMPPGVDLSKLTPEQRAMVEAAMRGRANGPTSAPGGGMVTKMCMTKEKLASGKMTPDRPGQPNCKQTVTKSTATTRDITEVCTTAAGETTTDIHVEMLSPTSTKITAKTTGGRAGGTTVTMTNKWLSADCGDVK